MRTRVKICGITRIEDALEAIAAGADALGFVFYKPSPRYISPEKAGEIISQLPPFVTTVALFVNEPSDDIYRILEVSHCDLIQFHGDESAEFCESFNRPWIKALRVKDASSLSLQMLEFKQARALLLDSYRPGVPGGTGETFNWELIPEDPPRPLILAGGLTPENISSAVQQLQPYGVDVSGGVEAQKGIKDPVKIHAFIRGANP
ncbi:phosphoribosylanthranilate isomerase [Oceanospirillum linum]|uniref:N-(5'-phosphoribosyl)anthranilate isomerase n=1 Tax=Oceanospirillum linum TaxID=966 RepID=A0A1T1HER5_OCELI|nr:phosphoribosylanthranilate isomerase [Oceanospirillum linum]OOV88302.1 N-(5'-phosphoribosyl)anthranilate isomerase [Oceanospirillum linum]SEF51553.1 phosphoribosylanthranilate isomerase [Oleiphilus messinensis]SMP04061.1 phosphoribosylanthranilate isomerase [Oceanospirillum linum]